MGALFTYLHENQQLLAPCWGLACAFWATVQYHQRTVAEAGTQTAFEDNMAEAGTQTTTTVIVPVVQTKNEQDKLQTHTTD